MSAFSLRTLFVFSLLLPIVAFATFPNSPGLFVIRGFSNSHLLWQPTDSGSVADLGSLGAGASRVRVAANYVLVTNSGSFSTGAGSALWYASFDSVAVAIQQQRAVGWSVRSFADYSDAYDVAYANGFAWVTLLGSSQLAQVNLATNTTVNAVATGANPQDLIAFNGKIFVSASGSGDGTKVFAHHTQSAQVDTFNVGINPQGLASDPATGRVYVACSGRSWATPPVDGSVWVLDSLTSTEALETPSDFSSACVTTNGLVYFSDESTTPRVARLVWDPEYGYSLFPSSVIGGWNIFSDGSGGVFVTSENDSTIREYSNTESLLHAYRFSDVPAASCYWQGSTSGVPEVRTMLATHFELPQVYPNPFNATAQIRYRLPNQSVVRVVLFNAAGQQVALLANGRQPAGEHALAVDGTRLSSGTYFLAVEAAGNRAVRSIQLLK